MEQFLNEENKTIAKAIENELNKYKGDQDIITREYERAVQAI